MLPRSASPSRPAATAARARRLLLLAPVVALLAGCAAPAPAVIPTRSPGPAAASPSTTGAVEEAALRGDLARLERRSGARLGVAVLDTGSGARLTYRAAERFAFASTNKVFVAAATLRGASDRELGTVVPYGAEDLVPHSPVTAGHAGTGMSVRALVEAMLGSSDNTATNLLAARLGGPAAVQRSLASLGDTTTSVDRLEPDLNEAAPGDRRDTTTPAASARDLEAVLLGRALPADRRALLRRLLESGTAGGPGIRAGVPSTWAVAHKTGSGGRGTRNDVAVVRPPDRAPIVLVLLSDRPSGETDPQDELLVDATRAVIRALGSASR